MNITETKQEDPDLRIFNVSVTASAIEERIVAQLQEIAPKVSIPGFRPGKVPLQMVRKNYEGQITEETLQTLVNEGIAQILKEQDVVPAMDPDVRVDQYIAGQDLNCTIEIVPLPKIELPDFSSFQLERPVTEADTAQIDDAIHHLQLRQSSTKEIEPRTLKDGDIVVIDYQAENEKGEAVEGAAGKDTYIELGQHHFSEDLENILITAKVGSDISHTLSYPDDYFRKDMAGQNITYHMHVKSVHEKVIPEINESFANSYGFSSVAQMRDMVKASLENEYQKESDEILKRRLLDRLQEEYKDIRVPKAMAQREYSNIWQQYITSRQENTLSAEEAALDEDAAKDLFTKLADRRVLLALVLTSVSRAHNLNISNQELEQAIGHIIQSHPEDAKRIRETYQQAGARQQLQANMTEQKIVHFILDKVSVEQKTLSLSAFQDIVRNAETLTPEKEDKPKKKSTAAKKADSKEKAEKDTEDKPKKKSTATKKADSGEKAEKDTEDKPKKKSTATKKTTASKKS